MAQKGILKTKVAEKLGLSIEVVNSIAEFHKIEFKKRKALPVGEKRKGILSDPVRAKKAVELRQQGLSMSKIRKRVGCHYYDLTKLFTREEIS